MASSSSSVPTEICSFGMPEYDYDGRQRFCYCGHHAPRMISWTDSNPGRRFFGCPIYDPQTKKRACRFFEWFEAPIFSGRAKELVLWLLHAKKEVEDDLSDARHRNEAMKMRVIDETNCWQQRCASLEVQVKNLASLEQQQQKNITSLEQQVKNLNSMEQEIKNLNSLITRTKEEVSKLKSWKKCAQACFSCFLLVVFYFAIGNMMISGNGLKRLASNLNV